MSVTQIIAHPILSTVGSYVLYLAGLVIYRLYFHPLAKFPGPKYAALSRWHEFYYEVVLKGQFTFKVQELHKQYGNAFPLSKFAALVTMCRSYRPYRPRRAAYPGLGFL